MLLVLFVTLFVSVSASLGDINSDDKISASDARFILRIAAKLEKVTDEEKKNADINADGNVTSADARIVLRISAKLESIDDYIVEVEPTIVNAEIAFSITDDGYFVGGESAATINITPDADCAVAEVKIVDAADEVAYAVTLENLKQDVATTFEWNGQTNDGNYANSGSYRIVVTINETQSVVDGLEFTNTNYFSGGNGSEKSPFLVASIAEFENIVRFPKANYKQVNDFDYEYNSAKSLFASDIPFNGVYDGNDKIFSNVISDNALINYVGSDGVIKNVKIVDSSFSSASPLVIINNGQIKNCSVNATASIGTGDADMGLICSKNYGTVIYCEATGAAYVGESSQQHKTAAVGGIVGRNFGKILNCTADVDVSAYTQLWGDAFAGGIVGVNEGSGIVQKSEAKGTIKAVKNATPSWGAKPKAGGIAGFNDGQLVDCLYTGENAMNLSGDGSGVVA